MSISADPVQVVPEQLRAAVQALDEDTEDLSKCERHLKVALDALTELLTPVPSGAGKVPIAVNLGLDSSRVRATHTKVAAAYQRSRRLERPSVTQLYELASQWPPLLKKE